MSQRIKFEVVDGPQVEKYRNQIAETGQRFERLALALFGFLGLLLLVFLLPAANPATIARLAELREECLAIEVRIAKLTTKTDHRRDARAVWADTTIVPRRQPALSDEESKAVARLDQIDKASSRLEEKLLDLPFDAMVYSELKEARSTVVGQLGDIEALIYVETHEEVRSIVRDRLLLLREMLDLEIARIRRDTLFLRKIPVTVFSVLGVSVEGLSAAELPVLYVPLVWSMTLLALVLLWFTARRRLENLYSRLLNHAVVGQKVDPTHAPPPDPKPVFIEKNAEEILGATASPFWWLAPLPRYEGTSGPPVQPYELRNLLGFKVSHRLYSRATTLVCLVLVLLQCYVLYLDSIITAPFTGAASVKWTSVVHYGVAFVSTATVLGGLTNRRKVLDFATNNEPSERRRLLYAGLVLAIGARAHLSGLTPGVFAPPEPPPPTCRPRSRDQEKRRRPWSEGGGLATGFYTNVKTGAVYYLSLATNAERGQRGRTRRLPFRDRFERKLYATKLARWRFSGRPESERPRRLLFKNSSDRPAGRCATPVSIPSQVATSPVGKHVAGFRHVAQLPKHGRLRPLTYAELIKSLERSKPRARATDTAKNRASASVAPRLAHNKLVFSIEQEALRLIRQSPENVDRACKLLLAGIEARGRSLETIRLFDLLAGLSYRYNRTDDFQKAIEKAKEYAYGSPPLVELSTRSKRWSDPASKWRKKWTKSERTTKFWASLPM